MDKQCRQRSTEGLLSPKRNLIWAKLVSFPLGHQLRAYFILVNSSSDGKPTEKAKRGKFTYRPKEGLVSRDHYNDVVDGWFAIFESSTSSASSQASVPGGSLVRKRLRKDGALISDSTASSDVFGEDNWVEKLKEMRRECRSEDLWLESLATRLIPPPPPLDDTIVEPRRPIRLDWASNRER